jgi:hypothetical protein
VAFTNCTVTVNNIASLSDLPNVTDGLSAATLKGKFDQTGTDLKTFLNSTLLSELANTGSGTSASENIGGRSVPAVTGSTIISAGTLYSQLVAIQGKIGSFVTGTGFMPTSGGTFTGQVSFPDGTAADPSIRHVGDTDTGIYFPNVNEIGFSNAGSDAMHLKNGDLGVGTISPAAKLHVSGTLLSSTGTNMFVTRFATTNITPDYQFFTTDSGSAILAGRFSADASSARIYFAKSRNATEGSHTVVQSGDQLGGISFGGSDGTNISEGVRISAEVDGTPGANDMPGRLVFLTTADGSATPTERLRISSTGLLTSPQTFAQLVTVGVRTVLVDSSGQIGNATSSLRYKQNIEDLESTTENILKLSPKTFLYKEDVIKNGDNAVRTVGLIAEQAKELGLTYLYNEDENGIPDYFAYDKLSVYLLKVIQEQQSTIKSLTARLELLESKVV